MARNQPDKAATKWTKPYYGVTHYGELGAPRRVTVSQYGSRCELKLWRLECGFSPDSKWFDDLEAAKAAGERWVETGDDHSPTAP